DAQGKTYLSRITNHFSSGNDGFIICMSDSPDKFAHPNFNLGIHDIRHIWYAEWYFTARMPNVHEQSFTRVSNVGARVDLLNEEIRRLQKRLTLFLRKLFTILLVGGGFEFSYHYFLTSDSGGLFSFRTWAPQRHCGEKQLRSARN